jgi:multidrug resistance efflux pump
MTERTGRPWLNYLLGLLCAGAVVAAILVVGPASGSTTAVTRTAKAAEGVVQSTVSGSGNLQAANQLNLGFKTSGTVTNIYVTQGEYVTEGKLIAELNPQSAEVTLEQSKAALLSAEAALAKEEETDGETATGSGGSSGSGAGAGASAAAVHPVDYEKDPESTTTTPSAATPGADTPAPAKSPDTTTSPAATTSPATTTTPAATTTPTTTAAKPTHTATSPSTTGSSRGEQGESKSSGSASKASEGSTAAKTVVSAATREANLASARAAVKSDQLTVQSDEDAVANTKLYAPENGTIVTLSGQVGEVVSASGTTRASSGGSSGSGSSGSDASTGGDATGARSSTGASSSTSGSGSSSSSSFAVLSDLSSMQLVVALSESEIGHVKVGQFGTVTVEALESGASGGTSSGAQADKLAAHVSEVATLSTSSSGVVSYDVTFQLDQMESGLKPGMSATAEVVVKQAEGVNVPTTAISADSVTVVRDGKDVRQRVTTGLAGNTSTIVLSGLKAGETVVLPAATSTSSSTSLTSRLSSRLGGGGIGGGASLGGGGFGGGGGAGPVVSFRGGG